MNEDQKKKGGKIEYFFIEKLIVSVVSDFDFAMEIVLERFGFIKRLRESHLADVFKSVAVINFNSSFIGNLLGNFLIRTRLLWIQRKFIELLSYLSVNSVIFDQFACLLANIEQINSSAILTLYRRSFLENCDLFYVEKCDSLIKDEKVDNFIGIAMKVMSLQQFLEFSIERNIVSVEKVDEFLKRASYSFPVLIISSMQYN